MANSIFEQILIVSNFLIAKKISPIRFLVDNFGITRGGASKFFHLPKPANRLLPAYIKNVCLYYELKGQHSCANQINQ